MTHDHKKLLEDRTFLCIGTPGKCASESMTITNHWTSEDDGSTCVRCGAKLRWTAPEGKTMPEPIDREWLTKELEAWLDPEDDTPAEIVDLIVSLIEQRAARDSAI